MAEHKIHKRKKACKTNKKTIVPSINAKTTKEFLAKVNKTSGFCKEIHIDVMDGKFVKEKTITKFPSTPGIKKTYHLMVEKPEKYLYADADTIIVHAETVKPEFLAKIKAKKGITLNPDTKLDVIKPFIKHVDEVLVLAVKPGKSGQKFKPAMLERIRKIRKNFKGKISIDGGINLQNINQIAKAGADKIVSATALFKGNIEENYKKMKQKLAIN